MSNPTFLEKHPQPAIIEQSHMQQLITEQQQQQQNGINHADINWIKIDVEGAEFEVLKGATDILSNSKDIALLIEVHNLNDGTNLYMKIVEFLGSCYNFKIEYEKIHDGGERHIIVRKST